MGFRDGTVQLQIATQVKVDVARSAITGVVTEEAEDASKQDSGQREKVADASRVVGELGKDGSESIDLTPKKSVAQ